MSNRSKLLDKKLYLQAVRKARDFRVDQSNKGKAKELEVLSSAKLMKFKEDLMPRFANFINMRADKIGMNIASQVGIPDAQFKPYTVILKPEVFIVYLSELNIGISIVTGIVQIEISYEKTGNVICLMLLGKQEKEKK